MATVARRLRKRMRAARSAADDTLLGQQPDHSIWTFLARLQTLIEQLELRADTELAYSRDRLQEDVEYSAAVGDEAIDGDMRSFRNSTRDVDEDQRQKQKQSSYLQQKQVDGGLGLQQPLQERGERLKSGLKKTVSGIEGRVSEFVRKDGSIDVDGLRGWARRLLDSIGVIWMRLNGRTPSTTSSSDTSTWTPTASNNNANTQMTLSAMDLVNYGDDDREARLRDEIGQLEKQLNDSSKEREAALRREDQLGKLIRARQLRQMDDDVNALRRTLAVRVLQFELERVLVGVAEEITRADFDTVLDQRVLVIEFGDLDERLSTLDVFLSLGESILIEDDVLGELAADMQDMKTRLGLDAPLYSSATVSMEQVRQFFTSSSKKARAGFDFYSRGLRLFVGDLGFAWSLISRTVASGYTPSAREVRTLRRTGRDLLTLVPFTIVLIAPLTPVGHVLIFSFLQRYWPEFFPSTFSERRQTMMRKRETYLAKLQSEGKSEHDDFDDDNDDDMNNINGTMDRASTMDDDDDLSAWSRTPGSTTFNPRNPFARRPFSKKRRNKNAAQSNGAASVTGEDERLSRTAAATNSAPSSVDLNIDDLTGKTRAGDVAEQARKERQRVALDELHLAD